MSSLFNVTIQPSTLPGQHLYPKLATAKLEDPMLQPMVEKKGCEKVLGDMRDCLVEKNSWEKCDEEMQRFQQCINTKYFQEEFQLSEDMIDKEDERDLSTGEIKVELTNEIEDPGVNNNDDIIEEKSSSDDFDQAEHSTDSNKETADNTSDITQEQQGSEEVVDLKTNEEVHIEQDNLEKDSFRVKIVPKSEDLESDENLLFKVTLKNVDSGM